MALGSSPGVGKNMWPKQKHYPKQIIIPTKKRIIYSVNFKREINDRGVLCDGLAIDNPPQIYIKSNLPAKTRFEVLVHETLHAVEFATGIDVDHDFIDMADMAIADLVEQLFERK